ncbi:MAG TPA: bifunctional adenosylcobinamide kinase/adenosylcobinamide-phosphate guanylyltransferase [Blastocatellia bacterium]|jgi:adenosylcobinamide kinase/adenosylcobinamide-phosphate guanylyltransferase|nr:bifunctional adenosylcobinamide kinase/adenosylcobinamide-phosphate guanylyltransferase [Blastocatellia bacterium]
MLTLILGGARSGKSRYAQSLCGRSAQVVYIATARADEIESDQEMRERVARHRSDRPASWRTVEEPLDLPRAIREAPVEAVLLIDCVTLWISNLMWEHRGQAAPAQENQILEQVDDLILASRRRAVDAGEIIIVSNDVGGGLTPEHPVGRAFRDLQGFANQRLAQAADKVILIVAGLPLPLKSGSI